MGRAGDGDLGARDGDDCRGGAAEGDRAGTEEVETIDRHASASGAQAGRWREDINKRGGIGQEVRRHAQFSQLPVIDARVIEGAVAPSHEAVTGVRHRGDLRAGIKETDRL